jgi:hypothetical protein
LWAYVDLDAMMVDLCQLRAIGWASQCGLLPRTFDLRGTRNLAHMTSYNESSEPNARTRLASFGRSSLALMKL